MNNAYFQNDVRTASGEALVVRLLDRAIRCASDARALDRESEAARRAPLLRRTFDIVAELQGSLNLAEGGEIASNLDRLYDFVTARLSVAGLPDGDAAIDDALHVLGILADAWRKIASECGAAHEVGDVSCTA